MNKSAVNGYTGDMYIKLPRCRTLSDATKHPSVFQLFMRVRKLIAMGKELSIMSLANFSTGTKKVSQE